MLSCRDVTELASDHLESGLTGITRFRFRLHVLMCGNCRRYLDQLRQTVALVGALPPEPVPAGAERRLLDAFRRVRMTK